ncbi:MAG: hypothetical protein KatS3mg115_1294 [Candidatus Poribacteria bacterium]|nr:MAG: hypothetical protein KatS3mg115_1294 [Candidatus Poribacteria bacterium]
MKLTPIDIYQKQFHRRRLRGLDPEEVEEFLFQVAEAVEDLLEEKMELERRLEVLQNRLRLMEAEREERELQELQARPAAPEEAPAEADPVALPEPALPDAAEMMEITVVEEAPEPDLPERPAPEAPEGPPDPLEANRLLIEAETEARRLIDRARAEADRILAEAQAERRRLLEEERQKLQALRAFEAKRQELLRLARGYQALLVNHLAEASRFPGGRRRRLRTPPRRTPRTQQPKGSPGDEANTRRAARLRTDLLRRLPGT